MKSHWVNRLFIERSDVFLQFLNQRWLKTNELVNGITRVLRGFGIRSGNLLDICCGNGRISIHMAKKGFRAVGVDISRAFLEDATRRARNLGVRNLVTFLEGDIRKLGRILKDVSDPFDVVVDAWTSVGVYGEKAELDIFKQARKLSREGAVLFVAETMHAGYLSVKFVPTSFTELRNIVLLENRKYEPITSTASTSWTLYNKRGRDLEFVDKIDIRHHIYSLRELSSLLRKAGWETVASYGDLSTLQSLSPLTYMNIVAKAI